jgi:hypothetical protein
MCTYDTDVKLCDLQHISIICDQHFPFTVIAQFIAHFIAHQQNPTIAHLVIKITLSHTRTWVLLHEDDKVINNTCATVVGFLCARIGNNNVWQQGEC